MTAETLFLWIREKNVRAVLSLGAYPRMKAFRKFAAKLAPEEIEWLGELAADRGAGRKLPGFVYSTVTHWEHVNAGQKRVSPKKPFWIETMDSVAGPRPFRLSGPHPPCLYPSARVCL